MCHIEVNSSFLQTLSELIRSTHFLSRTCQKTAAFHRFFIYFITKFHTNAASLRHFICLVSTPLSTFKFRSSAATTNNLEQQAILSKDSVEIFNLKAFRNFRIEAFHKLLCPLESQLFGNFLVISLLKRVSFISISSKLLSSFSLLFSLLSSSLTNGDNCLSIRSSESFVRHPSLEIDLIEFHVWIWRKPCESIKFVNQTQEQTLELRLSTENLFH